MRARRWLVLAAAIAVEVTATLALKAALVQPAWFVVVVLGYAAAFVLLGICLRLGAPIGVTYGVWGAAGVVLTAVLASVVFDEALTGPMLGGIGLIIAGVLVVEIGAQRASAENVS